MEGLSEIIKKIIARDFPPDCCSIKWAYLMLIMFLDYILFPPFLRIHVPLILMIRILKWAVSPHLWQFRCIWRNSTPWFCLRFRMMENNWRRKTHIVFVVFHASNDSIDSIWFTANPYSIEKALTKMHRDFAENPEQPLICITKMTFRLPAEWHMNTSESSFSQKKRRRKWGKRTLSRKYVVKNCTEIVLEPQNDMESESFKT